MAAKGCQVLSEWSKINVDGICEIMCAAIKSKCPTCRNEVIYSIDNPSRPFCSERCRLKDLGAWLDGAYSIAAEEDDSENSSAEDSKA
jgi:uncharacterized protein